MKVFLDFCSHTVLTVSVQFSSLSKQYFVENYLEIKERCETPCLSLPKHIRNALKISSFILILGDNTFQVYLVL